MAQYDIIFVKNTAGSGIDFAEQSVPKPAGAGYFLTQDAGNGNLSWSKTLETPVLNGTVSGTAIVTTLDSAPAAGKLADALTIYNKINNHLAANDAMVFKGTLGTGGTVTALPTTGYSAGWTYRVVTAGTYGGDVCEVGDMIVCVKDFASTFNNTDFTTIQTNIDGAVIGPASAVDNRIAVFNGTSGKSIKMSGTISIGDIALKSDAIANINALGSGSIDLARLNASVETTSGAASKASAAQSAAIAASLPIGTTLNGKALSGNTSLTKADVGLSNVPNVDATNAANITAGTFNVDRIPALPSTKISGFDGAVLGASTNAYKTATTVSQALAAIASDMTNIETFSSASAVKRTNTKPASTTAAGALYDLHFDPTEGYLYVCLVGGAAGTARWKRTALASW